MRRGWIGCLALTGAFLATAPVDASEDLPAALAACRAEQDETKRLACYDRQADQLAERSAASATAPAAPAAQPTEGGQAAAGSTVAAAAAASSATPSAQSPAASTPAAAAAAQATAANAPSATPSTAEEKFGYGGAMARTEMDQKKKEEQALDEIVATVTQISTRPRGELVITLDNGQVWAQKTPESNFRLKSGDQVRIKAAALGSFIMTEVSSDRSTRVSRVR